MQSDNPKKRRISNPPRVIAVSFLLTITAGTLLFMLPFMTRDGKGLSFMQSLFTATSSVCVTGLTVIDPAVVLTRYGQALLLVLIEFGGISMVTFATFFIFLFKKRSGFRSLRLAQEYTNLDSLSQVKPLVRTIVATTVGCQLLGAAVLCITLVPRFGAKGVWMSVFTAVSAYCNAGFDVFGNLQSYGSLAPFNAMPLVMYPVMLLIITGGLGFYVFYDLVNYHKTRRLTLHTRVVAVFTLCLILYGFLHILIFEWSNSATLANLPLGEKITAALFQSVTTRTAGFSSVDISQMHDVSKLGMMILMFIGAGSGSTGGGIKITTFAVLFMTVVSVLRTRKIAIIMHRKVDKSVVFKSLAVAALGLLVIYLVSCVLVLDTPNTSEIDILFEAVSAFSTTGLSSGVTALCGTAGKLALIFAMYVGRVGPICFIIAINARDEDVIKEVLPEGRIMVG